MFWLFWQLVGVAIGVAVIILAARLARAGVEFVRDCPWMPAALLLWGIMLFGVFAIATGYR